MDNDEFFHHMEIIRDMLKEPRTRIILLHPPYTESQQVIIDTICRNSKKIIGQLVRTPPLKKAAQEIKRIILSHHEMYLNHEQLQFVVIGQQKIKRR